MIEKIVMVSGCFDLLHAGHIAFFKTAARYGKVHVYLGQDENIKLLKGKAPFFSQEERKFIVESVNYVEKASIASGMGILDFAEDMRNLKPDYFVVNFDGYTPEKKKLCDEIGVELLVLERIPEDGLPARSSSGLKREMRFPYRVCIAGGWVDQPWVSAVHPGSVVVAQLYPTIEFNDRSGMATSSRKVALQLWGDQYPAGDPVTNARLLFGAENPPGSVYVSGSQDHLGLLVPGISRLDYNGDYWPECIETINDSDTCEWLSEVLNLVELKPRPMGYNPIESRNLDKNLVRRLGESGRACFDAIRRKDVKSLGESMKESLLCWSEMLPATVPEWIMQEVNSNYFNKYSGAITSGAGGGYIVFPSESKEIDTLKIKIRY
jgi:cytidyltransferase-like protein